MNYNRLITVKVGVDETVQIELSCTHAVSSISRAACMLDDQRPVSATTRMIVRNYLIIALSRSSTNVKI